jgi:hypothetical protein
MAVLRSHAVTRAPAALPESLKPQKMATDRVTLRALSAALEAKS